MDGMKNAVLLQTPTFAMPAPPAIERRMPPRPRAFSDASSFPEGRMQAWANELDRLRVLSRKLSASYWTDTFRRQYFHASVEMEIQQVEVKWDGGSRAEAHVMGQTVGDRRATPLRWRLFLTRHDQEWQWERTVANSPFAAQ